MPQNSKLIKENRPVVCSLWSFTFLSQAEGPLNYTEAPNDRKRRRSRFPDGHTYFLSFLPAGYPLCQLEYYPFGPELYGLAWARENPGPGQKPPQAKWFGLAQPGSNRAWLGLAFWLEPGHAQLYPNLKNT